MKSNKIVSSKEFNDRIEIKMTYPHKHSLCHLIKGNFLIIGNYQFYFNPDSFLQFYKYRIDNSKSIIIDSCIGNSFISVFVIDSLGNLSLHSQIPDDEIEFSESIIKNISLTS